MEGYLHVTIVIILIFFKICFQLAVIIRNLSFEDENMKFMSENDLVFRWAFIFFNFHFLIWIESLYLHDNSDIKWKEVQNA